MTQTSNSTFQPGDRIVFQSSSGQWSEGIYSREVQGQHFIWSNGWAGPMEWPAGAVMPFAQALAQDLEFEPPYVGELTKAEWCDEIAATHNGFGLGMPAAIKYKYGKAELRDHDITPEILDWLYALEPTQAIDLSRDHVDKRNQVRDEHLPPLQKLLPVWLCLDGCEITDAGLAHLEGFDQLRALFCRFNRNFTVAGLKSVAKLFRLQTLALSGQFDSNCLSELSGMTSLTYLDLGLTYNDAALKHVGRLLSLEHLMVNDTVTDSGLAELRRLQRLQELHVYSKQVTTAGIRHINKLAALRSLSLFGCKVDDDALTELACLPALGRLHVNYIQFSTPALAKLQARARTLRELVLAECEVSDEGVQSLAALENLQQLSIDGPDLTDAGLAVIASSFLQLGHLSVKGPRITRAGLRNLAKLRDCLTWLDVQGNGIDDDALAELSELPKLTTLSLTSDSLTSKACATLGKMTGLQNLYLHSRNISLADRTRLKEALGPDCNFQ